jgi:tetratricopeptide (TPR) repeat protein
MTTRLPIDLDEDGRVRWPLDGQALEDLRWYLEDYLTAPFGVYEDRGARIEAALAGWGHDVFETVLAAGPVRDAYERARDSGDFELILRSSSAELLGMPWELMADPADEVPLALQIGGLSRSLPTVSDDAEMVPVPQGRLRVLMVICRPAGPRDVGYRMIARPLLDRLEAVRGQVDLVVLRPPTLEALRAELVAATQAKMPYQVVHFDGHGVFLGAGTAAGGEGAVVFEGPHGGPQYIPSRVIAQVLRDAVVPMVVLNACQSGAVGKELEAAIATRLLVEGIAAVVAMAYSVYSVAAAEFMAAFYERLFAGGTVAAAVSAGRQQMARRPGRPSPKGDLPLADWLVPVHYGRRDVSFPQAAVARSPGGPALAEALDAASVTEAARDSGRGPLDPADGVFVGRDDFFYDLEVTARQGRVIILAGPGGAGKTELAKAFGRWWRDTGGIERPDWVFWHTFEPGLASFGLDSIITGIGLRLHGTEFAALGAEQRYAAVLEALTSRKMLLIWDNFESVWSFADPGNDAPGMDETGREQLHSFIQAIAAHGPSVLLITSRNPEHWLGEVRRVTVGGLASQEAAEYADVLLAPYPAAGERRARRAFGELMEWLQGNPLALRLVLPGLDRDEPDVLLAQLRGVVASTESAEDDSGKIDGGAKVLAASVGYSYQHLTTLGHRLLPVISLLGGVADAGVLGGFSEGVDLPAGLVDVPERFSAARRDDWETVLDEATRAGLLTRLGGGLYQIHPALPSYLSARWHEEEPTRYDEIRDAAIRALAYTYASWGFYMNTQIESGDAGVAFEVIGLERRTLVSFLSHAVEAGWWDCALGIAAPLWEYWKARGLDNEAEFWADRVRRATEGPTGAAPPVSSPAGTLWLFALVIQAELELRHERLGEAELIYRQMIAAIQQVPAFEPQTRDHYLAAAYHGMGRVEQGRQQFGRAEDWLRRSVALGQAQGNKFLTAVTFLQLGIGAQLRRRFRQAEDWYRQALAVNEELANDQLTLGVYYQLGRVAEEQGRLDIAEQWFRRALAVGRDLADTRSIANAMHQLGNIAQDQGRLAVAQEWFRQALTISEELGDEPGVARSYAGLAVLADIQGKPQEALAWTVRAVVLVGQFPHPAMPSLPHNLSILAGRLGMAALEECWQDVTGNPLPRKVRRYVRPAVAGAKLRRRLGIRAPADGPPPVPRTP